MMPLTDAQLDETISVIRQLTIKHGYPPSLQEIGDMLGIGKNATHNRLVRLHNLGRVTWVPGLARTIRIIYPDQTALSEKALDELREML